MHLVLHVLLVCVGQAARPESVRQSWQNHLAGDPKMACTHLTDQMASHNGIPSVRAASRNIDNPQASARLAQSVERKALNLVVVGSSPTVGVLDWSLPRENRDRKSENRVVSQHVWYANGSVRTHALQEWRLKPVPLTSWLKRCATNARCADVHLEHRKHAGRLMADAHTSFKL